MKTVSDRQFLLKAKKIQPKNYNPLRRLQPGSSPNPEIIEQTQNRYSGMILCVLGLFFFAAIGGFLVENDKLKLAFHFIRELKTNPAHIEKEKVEPKAVSKTVINLPGVENLEVIQNGKGFRFSLKSEDLFEPGTLTLFPESQELIRKIAEAVKKQVDSKVEQTGMVIQWHGNEVPPPQLIQWYPTNWEFSAARTSVLFGFFENEGFSRQQLKFALINDSKTSGSEPATGSRVVFDIQFSSEN